MAEAKAKASAEKKESTVRRSKFADLYPDEAKITMLAESNPKKVGSKSFDIFAHYAGSKTVGEFRAKGGTYQSIAYDVGRGFVKVG